MIKDSKFVPSGLKSGFVVQDIPSGPVFKGFGA